MKNGVIKRIMWMVVLIGLLTSGSWADTATAAEQTQMKMIVLVGAAIAVGIIIMGIKTYIDSQRNSRGTGRGIVTPFKQRKDHENK